MSLLKALGSDDFHALFFQNQWDHTCSISYNWVKMVFFRKPIDPDLNKNLIIIIPKVHNPKSFSQFRPISVCTVFYKLVIKLIANWFKVVFPRIIA